LKVQSGQNKNLNISHYFLFLLITLAIFACYKMIYIYLNPVIFAIILAIITNPLYQWTRKKIKNKNLAAFFLCIVLTLVIIIPFLLIISSVITQGIVFFNSTSAWINAGNLEKFLELPVISKCLIFLEKHMADSLFKNIDVYSILLNLSSHAGEFLVNQSGYIIKNISSVIGKFFLMIFVFFFVVQEQKRLFNYIFHLIPLCSEHENMIIEKIKTVSKSALLGSIVTSLAQGIAGGIAFAICGLPGFFWGAVMSFASLIPMVGTALIWIPASLFLFFIGAWKYAVFMIIWSIFIVGMIDNFVRPVFMKGSSDMNTLVIFLSIIGGMNLFGLSGLLYGPLIFALTMVLLYIYDLEFHSFLKNQDSL